MQDLGADQSYWNRFSDISLNKLFVCVCVCLCPQTTLEAYPCGSDHTPSPMASCVPVEAESILDSPFARLTAVAISVKANHTIAFLGDSRGDLHKVTFFFFPPLLY